MLQPIMGFSALLLEHESEQPRLPERDRERLEVIHQSAKRGSELVRQILDFSRKDQELPEEEHSLDELFKIALKMVRATIPPEVRLYERISPELGTLCINTTAFHQLLLNLCSNAVLAIEAKQPSVEGEITLQAKRQSGVIELSIEDNGVGMSAEICKQVFDPFFTTRPMGEGSGMGMAVALGIVERAGGTL